MVQISIKCDVFFCNNKKQSLLEKLKSFFWNLKYTKFYQKHFSVFNLLFEIINWNIWCTLLAPIHFKIQGNLFPPEKVDWILSEWKLCNLYKILNGSSLERLENLDAFKEQGIKIRKVCRATSSLCTIS